MLEEATCTSDGTMRTVCTRCGLSGSRTLEKGHDFGSWNTTTAPTDHTKGEKTRVCRHCGKKETESFYPEGTLYKDIQNKRNEVSQIQRLLTDMGYLNDKIDGIFGKKTESAVKAFQADFGFKTDGIAWPQTIQRLNSAWNTQFGPPESTGSGSPEPGASASAFCYLLILDDGTEYWDTCDAHSEIFYNATMNINGDLSESDVLMLLEEAWLQELDLLYASLIELSPAEEQPLITNNKTFFYGYLNTQRTLWNDQYGENSVEALSLVLDAIMLQGHSLCQSVYLLNQ